MHKKVKEIKVTYLVIDAPCSYNMTIGHPNFHHLGITLSILYLFLKYPLSSEKVGVIQGDQEILKNYNVKSLKLKKLGLWA